MVLMPGCLVTIHASGLNQQGLSFCRITFGILLLLNLLLQAVEEGSKIRGLLLAELKVRHARSRVVLTRVLEECG